MIKKNPRYLATELCECSVADIIDRSRRTNANETTLALYDKISGKLSIKEILRQSTDAVKFIHSFDMIHRSLHPDNFLISSVESNKDHYIIKLTDFQRHKNFKEILEKTGTESSEGWDAPEIFLDSSEKPSNKTDAFILGCYYFYVLSGGKHPFGSDAVDRRYEIKRKDSLMYKENWNGGQEWKTTNLEKVRAFLFFFLLL